MEKRGGGGGGGGLPFSVRHAEMMSSFKFKRKSLSLCPQFPSARPSCVQIPVH